MGDLRHPLNLEAIVSAYDLNAETLEKLAEVQAIAEAFKSSPTISNAMIGDLAEKVAVLKVMVEAAPRVTCTHADYIGKLLELVKNRPVAMAAIGEALLAALVAFGLQISAEQKTAIITLAGALLAFWTQSAVVPTNKLLPHELARVEDANQAAKDKS